MQTRQGFSPKRMLSLPRLHKIGPGGRCVCKRGKGFRRNGCFHCRDCTKSALEGILSANAARVFAQTDAFSAAIAQNRPWRAFCLQTWQGFSPKRTLSLPRLHEIGHGGAFCPQTWQGFSPKRMLSLPRLHEIDPGGWSVCKRGKAYLAKSNVRSSREPE